MQEEDHDVEMDVDEDGASDEDLDEEDDDDDDEELDDQDDNMAAEPPAPVEEDAAIARRRAIQEIMRNQSMTQEDKNRAIQNLMSGGRTHVAPPPAPVLAAPEANAACVHYERNCNIVAPCCDRVFGCRICHDELSPTGHGPMNRFLIREVVCKNCNTRQAARYVLEEQERVCVSDFECTRERKRREVESQTLTPSLPYLACSNQCVSCATVFGEYHCDVCNLWMSMVREETISLMMHVS